MISFIVFYKDGRRETVTSQYEEGSEQNLDAAWDWVYMMYPEAEYIELFKSCKHFLLAI